MCGIAGVLDRRGETRSDEVARMLASMEHRGPDGSGTFAEDGVVLGHRRLAILDPSPAGAQPMMDASGRFVCTFNGAIYNFVELRSLLQTHGFAFRSTGDTEVLLMAFVKWGAACLDRLNGMFALAIYDRATREIFCARDRLGVKPLVYAMNGRWFAFASEHKALISAGLATARPSAEGVYEFIAKGCSTGGRTLYEDIRSLPPGSALTVAPDRPVRIWEWWAPGRQRRDEDPADPSAETMRTVLEDAVRLRLRSDVTVGAHLSGGLDSSSIVAAAVRAGGHGIATFTGAFPGVLHADERRYSRALADAVGVRRVEIELDVDDLARIFYRVLWHLDEPVAGPGVLPHHIVYDASRANGVKVVLTGQGGDELFGGYLRYRGLYFKSRAEHASSLLERGAAILELCRLIGPEWRRIARTSARVRDSDLSADFVHAVDAQFRDEVRRTPDGDGPRPRMLWDLRNYLPGLLHADDRISMAASVESRAPFLDYRLVELATAIPVERHFQPRVAKPLLREAAGPWLPECVARRRDKRGFPTPLERWKTHPGMRALVQELLRPNGANGAIAVFSDAYLSRPEAMRPSELWTVMLLQGWWQMRNSPVPALAPDGR
jgi:asparagine synthase (glutamine-hydrolysing)